MWRRGSGVRKTLYLAEIHDSMTSSALINSCAKKWYLAVRPKLLVSLFLFYFISLAEETKKTVMKLKKGDGRYTATAEAN